MKARRNDRKVMHEGDSQIHDPVSQPYLREAALDQEWEENFRNGNSRRTAHGSRTSSSRMETPQCETDGREGDRA